MQPAQYRNYQQIQSIIDIVLISIVFFALLLNLYIGPLTPMTLILFIPTYFVLRRHRLIGIFLYSWPVLLLPIMAIASALWSVDPGVTTKSGILYLITVMIGVILGAGIRHKDLMYAIFFTFFLFTCMSWVFGDFQYGRKAFQGLLASKNAMGDVAGILVISSICIIFEELSRRQYSRLILSVLGLFVGAVSLWLSEATTATIATGVATAFVLFWVFLIKLNISYRNLLVILSSIIILIIISSAIYWLPYILELTLGITGKDTTLTGRTELWNKADEVISERPLFGMGYNTFWHHGNFEAEALWRQFGIRGRSGFNFHSTYKEITVSLGYIGFALYTFIATIGAIGLFLALFRAPNIPVVFLCAVFITTVIKLPFESIGFGAMQLSGTLGFLTIVAGYTFFSGKKDIHV